MVEISLKEWQKLPQDSKKVIKVEGKLKFYRLEE